MGIALLVLASSASCIMSLDVLQLAEQAKKRQREAATGRPVALEPWEPAVLEVPKRISGGEATFRVRVYADDEYRLANVRWQDRIRGLVAEASGYLEEAFGAQLVIESMRPWRRQGAKDSTLQLLRELQAVDPGEDIDWVIGFVSPLGVLTTSIHEIGMANLLGRHFVLRGIDDREEAASLAKHFTEVDESQRDKFLVRRRQHKELVVFLHEWLHNLGAIHHIDRETLLHPSYAHQQRVVDPENAELVALALDARIAARGTGAPPDYAPLRAYLSQAQPTTWYAADRDALLATLPSQGPPATAASAPPRPAAAVNTPATLAALRTAVDEGRWDDAIGGCVGAPVSHPGGPAWSGPLAELCARSGMIAVAEQRLETGARGSAQEASARRAIVNARQLYGVPAGHRALAAEDEAARARAWFATRAAIDAGQLDRAAAALQPALQRFEKDSGLLALSCETAVRRSWTGDHLKVPCEGALEAWNEMPRALFWSALAQANSGNRTLAITRLRRAKILDPDFDGPWKVLADIYRFEGKGAELAALKSEYQSKFGKPLR